MPEPAGHYVLTCPRQVLHHAGNDVASWAVLACGHDVHEDDVAVLPAAEVEVECEACLGLAGVKILLDSNG